jgi:hypothetical protein
LQAAAYVERVRGVQGTAVEFNRYSSELNWHNGGRPYYKLWPGIIPLLAGVGVDVPVDYLRLPFAAFLVRFPMQDNPLRIDDQHSVRSILVNDGENDAGERRMFLWIDVGELHDGWPVLTFCQLDCVPGIAIEDVFDRLTGCPGSSPWAPRAARTASGLPESGRFGLLPGDRGRPAHRAGGTEQGLGPLSRCPETRSGRRRTAGREGEETGQSRLARRPA